MHILSLHSTDISGTPGFRRVHLKRSVYQCEALESIKKSKDVTRIGEETFAKSSLLKTVSGPEGLGYPPNVFPSGIKIINYERNKTPLILFT